MSAGLLPRWVRGLLRALAPAPDDWTSIVAELELEFAEISRRDGLQAARRRLRWQITRSVGPLLRLRLRQARRALEALMRTLLDGVGTDLKIARRRLVRSPGFAALAIVTLAIGIGANTTIFSLAYGIWLKPLPYDAARLLSINDVYEQTGSRAPSVSAPEIELFRSGTHTFEGIAGYSYGAQIASVDGTPVRIVAYTVTTNLFAVLGARPAIGRDFIADDAGKPVLILSDATWAARFGRDPGILNRTFLLSGTAYAIVGVMPRGFRFPMYLESELWLPRRLPTDIPMDYRYYQAIARLKPGSTKDDADRDVAAVAARLAADFPATNRGWTARTFTIDRRSMYRSAFGALLGIVGLFLLLACANLAGLLIARNSARRAELGLHRALGAGLARLTLQLSLEALVLAVAGGGAGLLLSTFGGRVLAGLMPSYLPGLADVGIDLSVAAYALLLTLVTTVACVVAPALSLRTVRPAEIVVGARSTGPQSRWLQSGLVVGEVAVAMLLLVGASLMTRSFEALMNHDRGFQPQGLMALNVSLPFAQTRYADATVRAEAFDEMMTMLSLLPGVSAAGATNGFPDSRLGSIGAGILTGSGQPAKVPVIYHTATPGYFEAMGVPIKAGRGILRSDTRTSPHIVVLNESLARTLWPDGHAVGRMLMVPAAGIVEGGMAEVVGVTGDLEFGTAPSPDLFFPFAQSPAYWADVVVRTAGDPGALLPQVNRALRAFNRDLLLENASTMRALIADGVGLQRAQTVLAAIVAILGALVSGVGLYALLSYLAALQTRELGIRLALGSTPRRLFARMLTRGAVLTSAGVVIGSAATAGLARALSHQVFGLATFRPGAFLLAAALLLAIAGVAIWIPARRVMRIDPLSALRDG